jgi:hypothetical protein
MNRSLRLLDSITDADAAAAGAVVVSGSHGGLYPAVIASRAGVHSVIFNDAGIGLDAAGIAGVKALEKVGMAAASADCMSCRIGSADDMMDNGIISFANAHASGQGVVAGQSVAGAAQRLDAAAGPSFQCDPVAESRVLEIVEGVGAPVLLVDSASLVTPGDAGRLIVAGSHGGLIGGDPKRALKARARLAAFHDAGIGKDDTGIGRLPALDAVGVAAVTVSHESARIGDARSCLETGVISAVNDRAAAAGYRIGEPLLDMLRRCEAP